MSIKALCISPSGEGKTSALASLLAAGYEVRVIDTDNGIPVVVDMVKNDPRFGGAEALKRLSYVTLTEQMRVLAGQIFPAKASVWPNAVGLLENWIDTESTKGEVKKLGAVSSWGDRQVLVIDTLSTLGTGAKNFHLMMNGGLAKVRTQNEERRDIGSAQIYVDKLIQLLYDTSIKCHVIVNTHMVWTKQDGSMPKDDEKDVVLHGYPAVIGKAISIDAQGKGISKYFNNLLTIKARRLWTRDIPHIALKTSAPTRVKSNYPLETGWADFFKDVLS